MTRRLIENAVDPHLADRIVARDGDNLLFLSGDRRHAYQLTGGDLRRLEQWYARATQASRIRLRIGMWLAIPFALFMVWLITVTGLGKLIDAMGSRVAFVAMFATLAGLPLGLVYAHYRRSRRALADMEDLLGFYPAVDAPPLTVERGLDRVEGVALVVMAPALIALLLQLFWPAAVRGTPLMATAPGKLAVAVLAALLIRRLLGHGGRRVMGSSRAS